MLASFALYAGGAATLAGAGAMLRRRTRGTGVALIAGGLGLAAAALAWPVSEERTAGTTHLDAAMPRWQFNEVHAIHVDADPRRVYDAIHAVKANEIRFFATLVAIRRGFAKTEEGILNPSYDRPILDVATETTFHYIADEAPREVVVGTRIGPRVDAAMNFLITPEARGCRVTTETRVFAQTPKAARLFAGYWRAIQPGSDIIRRMWLCAVKQRAEA